MSAKFGLKFKFKGEETKEHVMHHKSGFGGLLPLHDWLKESPHIEYVKFFAIDTDPLGR